MANYKIESTHIHLFSERDEWENGCDPDTGYSSTYDYPIIADTLDGFLNTLAQHTLWRNHQSGDTEIDSETGQIDICGMTDDEHNPASEADIAAWKRGEKKLRYTVWTVYAEQVTREPLQAKR